MTQQKVPHVHAELIKQWADGAEIQYGDGTGWYDITPGNGPYWSPTTQYRVKPEPKPDVVRYGVAHSVGVALNTNGKNCNCNLMLVFDGETGELKDAQVLARD